MQAAQVRSIASLKRGLDILSLVIEGNGLALRELHAASGVPKASLLRILKTLIEHQQVRKREGDGAYLGVTPARLPASACVPPSAESLLKAGAGLTVRRSSLSDAAEHLLAYLKRALIWPSDVAVPHGQTMRVIDSNRAGYGRVWLPSVIGEEVDMLDSAMGRAYLAFSTASVSQPLIDGFLLQGGARARRWEALARELQSTRQRGFAARDHLYAGPDTHHGRQLSAVAVPILSGHHVVACVSCVWSLRTASRSDVIEQSLAHLVRGACQFGETLGNPP